MPNHTTHDFAALNASDNVPTEHLKDAYIQGTGFTTFAATRERANVKVRRIREALLREAQLKAKDAEQAKRIAEVNAIRSVRVPTPSDQYQGHHADGSGVQNHSAGGLYPYILAVRDARGGQGYEYGILGGVLLDTLWVGSYDRAVSLALYFKANAKGFTI